MMRSTTTKDVASLIKISNDTRIGASSPASPVGPGSYNLDPFGATTLGPLSPAASSPDGPANAGPLAGSVSPKALRHNPAGAL